MDAKLNKSWDLKGRLFWATFALLLLLRFMAPGLSNLLGDELQLLRLALESNSNGEVAQHSLLGTKGMVYGPFVVWWYQLLFFLRGWIQFPLEGFYLANLFLKTSVLLFGVFKILKLFPKFPKLLFLVFLSSPYYFIYSRGLWDNPFLIELGLVAFCFFAELLRKIHFGKVILLAVLSALLLQVHLMCASFLAAMWGALLWEHRRNLKLFLMACAVALPVSLFVLSPYLSFLMDYGLRREAGGASLKGLEGVLLGFYPLSFLGFDYILGQQSMPVLRVVTYAAALLGLFLGFFFFRGLYLVLKKGGATKAWWGALSSFLLIFFVLHLPFALATNLGGHPHYFNGSWVVFFLLCAVGFSRIKIKPAVLRGLLSAQFLALLVFFAYLWAGHGIRSKQIGPSVSELHRVVEELHTNGLRVEHLRLEDPALGRHLEPMTFIEQNFFSARHSARQIQEGEQRRALLSFRHTSEERPWSAELKIDFE